ncbi:MAG: hypothetical protein PHS82_03305 [Lachnospiraceae bacterium]|nr:hypothetical protein [Lachnospiraceae bacterium]
MIKIILIILAVLLLLCVIIFAISIHNAPDITELGLDAECELCNRYGKSYTDENGQHSCCESCPHFKFSK